ncbi:hypothetical protein SAMN02927916_3792, partial [Flavobacterium anhuiense]
PNLREKYQPADLTDQQIKYSDVHYESKTSFMLKENYVSMCLN